MTHIAPIVVEPLTAAAFAAFGDVIEAAGPPRVINAGTCRRFHDLARLDFGADGRAGVSVFLADPVTLPHDVALVERHPDGSQAFLPLSADPFLVVVAPDVDGVPGPPRAFLTTPGQGINYHRGVWHGVLTPLDRPGSFAVVDRIGPGANLEEYRYPAPYTITRRAATTLPARGL